MSQSSSPLHIGIFGDYGATPQPDEGIGVFLFNLIDGLLEVEPRTRITFWVHPGEEHRLQRLLRRHGPAVSVYPPADWPWLGGWLDAIEALRHRFQVVFLGRTSNRVQRWLIARWKRLETTRTNSLWRLVGIAGLAALFCLLFPVAWLGAVAYHLLVNGCLTALAFPAELLLMRDRKPDDPLPPLPPCDVWLVPHGRTGVALNAPEVLILWDVAHHHVSGVFGSEMQELTDRLFCRRARRAALICCASQAVLKEDLRRLYPWAESRLRVVPLAPPRDLLARQENICVRRRFGLPRPYVFYPAAIRVHKNHATLIRALAWLRQRCDLDLELVCTGKGEQSPRLEAILAETEMSNQVRFLGLVQRRTIAALYRQAALAVVPSLHEGYGLPVMEALACGCPLACADLPTLRELLTGHECAVAFFDPSDPEAIGAAILETLKYRERYRQAQQAAFAELAQRDWRAVAADFLGLFHEIRNPGHVPARETGVAAEARVHA